jgi:hypothetical protein
MSVKELITLLSQHPDDLPIFIRSYELGYDEVEKIDAIELIANPTEHDYEGNFVTVSHREFQTKKVWHQDPYPMSDSEKPISGLLLTGDSRSSHY